MTSYRVMYQTRRQASSGISPGEWRDKEMVIVAGDDAMDAIAFVLEKYSRFDIRIKGVKVVGQVDAIALE